MTISVTRIPWGAKDILFANECIKLPPSSSHYTIVLELHGRYGVLVDGLLYNEPLVASIDPVVYFGADRRSATGRLLASRPFTCPLVCGTEQTRLHLSFTAHFGNHMIGNISFQS